MAADLGLSDAQFSATPTTRFDESQQEAKFLMQETLFLVSLPYRQMERCGLELDKQLSLGQAIQKAV